MRAIHQFNRWLRPTANTRARSWVVSALAVFALLLLPLSATSASAATVTHTSTVTQPLTVHVHAIRPDSDGGCDGGTAPNGSEVAFCFYIAGGLNYVHPMYAYWCNGGPKTVSGHVEITGPYGTFDGKNEAVSTGDCGTEEIVCPDGCYVPYGTYEGILWVYYNGGYNDVAHQYNVVES